MRSLLRHPNYYKNNYFFVCIIYKKNVKPINKRKKNEI